MQISDQLVLGIETSCDETAAALVRGDGTVLAQQLFSQIDAHAPYGGVVPEIAARAHISRLDGLIATTLKDADISLDQLNGIAATAGPGLIGGVLVGLMTGKALALAGGKPLIGVNHLEGHALSVRLEQDVPFPYLLLLVSGGHCQLLWVEGVGRYTRLGTTIDDAVGEAFDKLAKMLDLGYPGGPAVERLAEAGDPARFTFPRPLIGRDELHFSFSGLKTAVLRQAQQLPQPLSDQDKADLCAGFQAAICDCLADRVERAMRWVEQKEAPSLSEDTPPFHKKKAADSGIRSQPPVTAQQRHFVVAGGVAANRTVRTRLEGICEKGKFSWHAPSLPLCTDNAVMIAWAGLERLSLGLTDPLDLAARARWPLDPAAPPAAGAGVKA